MLLDNAHEWAESLLAELAVLVRLGTPAYKVCHLILAGPLSWPDALSAPSLAPSGFAEWRVSELSPLTLASTQAYIRQRLTIAGCPRRHSLLQPRWK